MGEEAQGLDNPGFFASCDGFSCRSVIRLVVECPCFLAVRVEESNNDTDMLVVCGKLPPYVNVLNFETIFSVAHIAILYLVSAISSAKPEVLECSILI